MCVVCVLVYGIKTCLNLVSVFSLPTFLHVKVIQSHSHPLIHSYMIQTINDLIALTN